MKVKVADTFLKSFRKMIIRERWYYKLYDAVRYDIPMFLKNIVRFRKELYRFRDWDSSFNLQLFKRSLEFTCNLIEKKGHEVESSKYKKVKAMRRAIELMDNFIEDNFIEQAERELGLEYKTGFDFGEEDEKGCCEMISTCTPEEEKNNNKIFKLSRKLEKDQWKELWDIIRGQSKCPKDVEWDDFFDGSNLLGWWD